MACDSSDMDYQEIVAISASQVTHTHVFVLIVVSIEAPVYLSSQSYMADSSLSEEMSQFDFSTGVQSFSFSSQNPEGQRRYITKTVGCVTACEPSSTCFRSL